MHRFAASHALARFTARAALACICIFSVLRAQEGIAADVIETIRRVKDSVVAVGTFEPGRAPPFQFRGTGFVVGDGTIVATNAHVLPPLLDSAHSESLAILIPGPAVDNAQVRKAQRLAIDPNVDLALLQIGGGALRPLKLQDPASAKEGQEILFTGFPIGAILGPFPATHRGMISAITPIAIAQGRAADLDSAVIRRLTSGVFPVFQLDATAYPGNSGSPVYDPSTGEVLGIVNMVLVRGTKEAALSQPSGITYAVPVNHLETLLRTAHHRAAK